MTKPKSSRDAKKVKLSWEPVNWKRVFLSVMLGVIVGLTVVGWGVGFAVQTKASFDSSLIASTIYGTSLIGFLVGVSDKIKVNPIARGWVFGVIAGMALGFTAGNVNTPLFWELAAVGALTGIFIDVVVTMMEKK